MNTLPSAAVVAAAAAAANNPAAAALAGFDPNAVAAAQLAADQLATSPTSAHPKSPSVQALAPGTNAVNIADYFNQLVRDKKNLQFLPNYFLHAERLLDDEINKVKNLLCSATDRKPLDLPEGKGPTVTLTEKIFVPIDKYPNFNFVGRILGPQGTTAKDIETYTGCKIMVRGEGSMRDKKKEDQLKGKPNFEHLNEKLHVLIQCEDTHNRCQVRMEAVIREIKKLLDPKPDGEDEIKRRQLMGLAVINGTYRETNPRNKQESSFMDQQQLLMPDLMTAGLLQGLNPVTSLGAFGGADPNLLNALNQSNLAAASLLGNPALRQPNQQAARGLPLHTLLPGSLPAVSAASALGGQGFLGAGALQSPGDAGLLYGYDPAAASALYGNAFAPLFQTQSPATSQEHANQESAFGAQKSLKLQNNAARAGSPYARNTSAAGSSGQYY